MKYQLPQPKTMTWDSPEERDRAVQLSRLILTFIKEASAEQLRQIPIVGPMAAGGIAVAQELVAKTDESSNERMYQLISLSERSVDLHEATKEEVRSLHEDVKSLFAIAITTYALKADMADWMSAHEQPVESTELSYFAAQAALEAYRGQVALRYLYVDHRGVEGVTRAAHVAALPLDDVYVMPRLIPERAQAQVGERERAILKTLMDNHDVGHEQRISLEEEYANLTGERWSPASKRSENALTIGMALKADRHLVLIGSPGVGKSVLTRYLARACALGKESMEERLQWAEPLVPIILPLAAFADARKDNPTLTLRGFLDSEMARRGGEALRLAIAEYLARGQVLLLLDGVDEVPEVRARTSIVQAVDNFVRDHSNNRCIITSRPYGYIRLAGELAHYQLPNFSADQVEEFVRKWQWSFECRQHPDAPNSELSDIEAETLLSELRRNRKVAELATNPLMLVIISLIRYEKARLPEERVQLYNRAVNTLMDTWNQWRSALGSDFGGVLLPLDRLIRVWGAVAEWTRRTRPTGVVHRAELKRQLVAVLVDREYDEDDPEATAESYLQAAADRAGLLEERGPEIFAFWHPTFEEFLAAVELTTPTRTAIDRVVPLRTDPRWREVILLSVGYVGIVQRDGDTATELVKAIADGENELLEPLFRSSLRLAASCIADDVGVRRRFAEVIIGQLASVLNALPYEQLSPTFVVTARALPRLRPTPETVRALAKLYRHDSWSVRMEALRLLGNVAAENSDAMEVCEQALNDSDPDVRCHAAFGLMRAGNYSAKVLTNVSMFKRSYAEIEPYVREFFADPPQNLIQTVREGLRSGNAELRARLAWFLRWLGRLDDESLEIVSSWLSTEEIGLRYEAAGILYEVNGINEDVRRVLRSWLRGPDVVLKARATEVLVRIGMLDEEIVDGFWVSVSSANHYVRQIMIDALQAESVFNEEWMKAVVAPIKSMGSAVELDHVEVMEVLRRAGVIDAAQLDMVLVGARESRDPLVRYRVGLRLLEQNPRDLQAVEAVRSGLSHGDIYTRLNAAVLLYDTGHISDEVIAVLESVIASPEDVGKGRAAVRLHRAGKLKADQVDVVVRSYLRDRGRSHEFIQDFESLEELAREDGMVVRRLIQGLNEDSEASLFAASMLINAGQVSEEVIQRVSAVLHGEDEGPRLWAARLLISAGHERSVLEDVVRSITPEPWVPLAACHRVLQNEPLGEADVEALVKLVLVDRPDDPSLETKRFLFSWLWNSLNSNEQLQPEEDPHNYFMLGIHWVFDVFQRSNPDQPLGYVDV